VEGEHWLGECLLGFSDCQKHFTCPTQIFWKRFKQDLTAALRQTSLADVLSVKPTAPSHSSRSSGQRPARGVVKNRFKKDHAPAANIPGKGSLTLDAQTPNVIT
jgi:hypothetical protein